MIFEHKAIIRLQQPLQNSFILLSDYFTVYHADHSFITLDSVHIRYDTYLSCVSKLLLLQLFIGYIERRQQQELNIFNGIGISYLIRIEYAA